jgi:hypothetical protein
MGTSSSAPSYSCVPGHIQALARRLAFGTPTTVATLRGLAPRSVREAWAHYLGGKLLWHGGHLGATSPGATRRGWHLRGRTLGVRVLVFNS